MAQYLAIDVGGTNIKYALMDEEAEMSEKGEYPTPLQDGLEGFISSIKALYDKYGRDAEAIVMSAPGKIDSNTGYFYTSGALQYINGINLKDQLHDIIPVPFAVENDGKSAALAEIWKGSMRGVENGAVLALGTGLAGGIIIGGRLYRGSTYAAGEFSGVSTNFASPTYSMKDAWAMMNSTRVLVAKYAARVNMDPQACNGRIVFEAANKGDENALAALEEYCQNLAAGIMSMQFILDVQKVAIGGGISKQPLLMEYLQKQIHLYYDEAFAKGMPATIPELTLCTFGNDANMIGALYHYLYELKK